MKTVEVKVFSIDELSDEARQKALEKCRMSNVDYDWWDFVYDDASRIAEILGIDLNQKPVKLMNGSTRYDPSIFFSGFSSQGDGACFEGTYSYCKGASKAIREYAPNDKELHRIADKLQKLQSRFFYSLSAKVKHTGRYCHEYSTDIDVWDKWNDLSKAEDDLAEILRDFMRWIYKTLESEYDYRTSEEAILEAIEANEWEFTEDGEHWG